MLPSMPATAVENVSLSATSGVGFEMVSAYLVGPPEQALTAVRER